MSLPREGARMAREGIVVSTPMNWGRSPQAIVPYRIHTQGQIEGARTAGNVRQTDQASYVEGSLIKACYGDEAGTGGGVLSGAHGGKCEPKTYSSTVRIEDKGVVSHSDGGSQELRVGAAIVNPEGGSRWHDAKHPASPTRSWLGPIRRRRSRPTACWTS